MTLLQEFCSSRGLALRIDHEAGLLRGVKLLGLTSKNGREYPEATLARAAALYEGAKVNVNHAKGHPLAPRDYQDRLGTIKNVVARPGEGLFGDLQFNPKHTLAEQLVWDAEHAPENVGFSHNVQARTIKRGDQTIVEEILAVQSVDLVADPATTRGLFESEAATDVGWAEQSEAHAEDVGWAERSEAHAAETRHGDKETGRQRDLQYASIEESPRLQVSPSPPLEPPLDQATEIESLRAENTRLQAAQAIAHKRAAIAALLVEHNLPPLDSSDPVERAIVSDRFVESLFAASDETAMRHIVRERATLLANAVGWADRREAHAQDTQRPVSREQTLVESHTDNTLEAFLKAIRT